MVVEKISGYRKNVDPRVTNNKDVFIRAANDIASIVKKTILGKNESIVCPEGYFVGVWVVLCEILCFTFCSH